MKDPKIMTKQEKVKILFDAVKNEDYNQIMDMLMVKSDHDVNILTRNEQGETLFMTAAKYGCCHIFMMLIDLTELLQIRQKEKGNKRDEEFLTNILAQRDKDGRTVVHHCLTSQSTEIIQDLVTLGVEMDSQDKYGNTILHLAAKDQKCLEFIKFLTQLGLTTKIRNAVGFLPIDISIMASNFTFDKTVSDGYNEIVRILKYSDLRTPEVDNKRPPTHIPPKLFDVDNLGKNIFHRIAWKGNLEEMQCNFDLVKNLKTVKIARNMLNDKDFCGSTPLHDSILRNKPTITQYLIDQGADINIQDNVGYTPIMEAISRQNGPAIERLLNQMADLELRDNRKRSARDIAEAVDCSFFLKKFNGRRTMIYH